MAKTEYSDELQRALDRPDVGTMAWQLDAYEHHCKNGVDGWPDEHSDDFDEIINCYGEDPDKALAYVIITVARSNDVDFLTLLGCLLLEDLLRDLSNALLARIVAEARKSPRFHWLLSCPYKVAVSEAAWNAIEKFRITGPHQEPLPETMPPRARSDWSVLTRESLDKSSG